MLLRVFGPLTVGRRGYKLAKFRRDPRIRRTMDRTWATTRPDRRTLDRTFYSNPAHWDRTSALFEPPIRRIKIGHFSEMPGGLIGVVRDEFREFQ